MFWILCLGEYFNVLFTIQNFLLNLCLPLKTVTTSAKLEKASLTAWSLMNSGRRMVTKIGSLPFLTGSTSLWKFRQIYVSRKRHWISVPSSFSFAAFDLKTKTNLEGETLYRAPISVTLSDSRMRKISGSRIFLWVFSEHIKWPSSDFSLLWAECDFSRDLCQTPPVRELFKPVEFGSRFSSGARAQSSSEGRTKWNVPFLDGYWLFASTEIVGCWLSNWFVPIKLSSVSAALMVVASSGNKFSSSWRFALFCGGELFVSSSFSDEMSALFFCSMVSQYDSSAGLFVAGAQRRWEIDLGALRKCPGGSCWGRLPWAGWLVAGVLWGSPGSRAQGPVSG